jgi:hypothetical protein
VGTNLESLMLKAGHDEDLAMEWVHMSHLYRISLLGFQYYMGLHTHLWKVATTYSWRHAELNMEKHVTEMHQIRQSRGTRRLQVICLTYFYLRDQRDTRGNLLETMLAEMETFKRTKFTTGGGEQSFKMVCFHCGMSGLHKGGKKCCQGKDLYQVESREKGLKFVTDALLVAN